jgi:hypothetical protein
LAQNSTTIDEIKALEDRRYRAMLAGDTAVLDELCSDDLIYTHSKADHDDKRSYLHLSKRVSSARSFDATHKIQIDRYLGSAHDHQGRTAILVLVTSDSRRTRSNGQG